MKKETYALRILFSAGIFPIIILSLLFITGCVEAPEGPSDYEGPSGMIDDFEVDFYETDESIHEDDWDPLYIVEQAGRRGHWVPFKFPHPVDALIPDSSVTLTHEACTTAGMPPPYTADNVEVTSTRAMHFYGRLGNPEGDLNGYVKVLTDLATDELWTFSSDYVFGANHFLLFFARAETECKIWVSLPAKADGGALSKGFLIELNTEWQLISIDLNSYNPSGEPGAEEPITEAVSVAFYIGTTEKYFNVAEGGTAEYDIWIDDIRISDRNN